MSFNVLDSYNSTVDFNLVAGNKYLHFDDISFLQVVKRQVALIAEECKELEEAVAVEDWTEVADAVCDIRVVSDWLQELLYQAGFDMESAMEAVAENNMSKLFKTYSEALETKEYYEEEKNLSVYIESKFYKGKDWFVVKNAETGKILKPKGFVSVDLTKFVPEV